MEGEEVDAIASANMGDRIDLKLPQNQIDYFNQLAEKKKSPLILVIASGSPVSIEGLEDKADAILQMWYPGEQGGNALADVLFGDLAPSGHLPLTFPRRIEDLPPYEDYNMYGRTYKYMEKEPLYPFGFGLSYSQVSISELESNLQSIKNGDSLSISFEVTNTGVRDIEEVIQLYLSPNDSENLPYYNLLEFKRIKLSKGEKQQLNYTIPSEDFKYFDVDGQLSWHEGDFQLQVSNALPSKRAVELGAASPTVLNIRLK